MDASVSESMHRPSWRLHSVPARKDKHLANCQVGQCTITRLTLSLSLSLSVRHWHRSPVQAAIRVAHLWLSLSLRCALPRGLIPHGRRLPYIFGSFLFSPFSCLSAYIRQHRGHRSPWSLVSATHGFRFHFTALSFSSPPHLTSPSPSAPLECSICFLIYASI